MVRKLHFVYCHRKLNYAHIQQSATRPEQQVRRSNVVLRHGLHDHLYNRSYDEDHCNGILFERHAWHQRLHHGRMEHP